MSASSSREFVAHCQGLQRLQSGHKPEQPVPLHICIAAVGAKVRAVEAVEAGDAVLGRKGRDRGIITMCNGGPSKQSRICAGAHN